MSDCPIKMSRKAFVAELNARGLTAYSAKAVLCNVTGRVLVCDIGGAPSPARAELMDDGSLKFFVYSPEAGVGETMH